MTHSPSARELHAPILPTDVVARAQHHLHDIKSVGAYSPNQGLRSVAHIISNYIAERDGELNVHPTDGDIFVGDGASAAVKHALSLLLSGPTDGMLIPIPQYPLYSACLTLSGGAPIRYNLCPEREWAIDVDELERAYNDAVTRGITPRGVVVINPGNPTGAVMSKDAIGQVVTWAASKRIAILADEVYQVNCYEQNLPFVSFRKVVDELRAWTDVDLFSFHSASKGLGGECGFRGGYLEAFGLHPDAVVQLIKLTSLSLGSNVPGQIAFASILAPPMPGDESYYTHKRETTTLLKSLTRRAKTLANSLEALPGMTCSPIQGAMYAYPEIEIPPRAIEEANGNPAYSSPDEMYCLQLLEETGICVVPGSGFGSTDGRYYFRTTILPKEEQVAVVASKLAAFHNAFMERWR